MAEGGLSMVEKVTEVFSTEQIEASARRTKLVQRASKITGKLFLALVTLGRWSNGQPSMAQLAAKAAQLAPPVTVTPEALQQRMPARAVAFLQALLQRAFRTLHTQDTGGDEALFAPCARVQIADSPGFGLPASLLEQFPGAGGSGSKAGAKIQWVWEYLSQPFAPLALIPWTVPDKKYVDTGVELAHPHSLFLFDLGSFKLAACAQITAARAYFLSRRTQQATLEAVVEGRGQPLDLPRCRAQDSRPRVEKSVLVGARARVAARLSAVRMPEALVNERRRHAHAIAKKCGSTPSQAYLTLLAWHLFITNVPASVWPPQTGAIVYPLRWQVELVFKAWKSHLPLAPLTPTTKNSTLCSRYARLLLIVVTFALGAPVRATVGQTQQREVSLIKLVRHCQAGADQWLRGLFQSPPQLTTFLAQACAAAERLVRKAVRTRRTSAQRLRDSLGPQVDFFEPALALAA